MSYYFIVIRSTLHPCFAEAMKVSEGDTSPFGDHFFRREEESYYGSRLAVGDGASKWF